LAHSAVLSEDLLSLNPIGIAPLRVHTLGACPSTYLFEPRPKAPVQKTLEEPKLESPIPKSVLEEQRGMASTRHHSDVVIDNGADIDLLSPSRPLQSNQAVDAHTSRAPAPPNLIRAAGPDLRYQMGLLDTVIMIEQSLASSLRREWPVDVSACMMCDGVSWAGGGGGGEDERAVVRSGSPRPPRRQHLGGAPFPTSSEASGWSQQRDCAAGGGEGTAHRGSSDCVSCASGGGLQASSSVGGLSDR
jgi:hypothetical protein